MMIGVHINSLFRLRNVGITRGYLYNKKDDRYSHLSILSTCFCVHCYLHDRSRIQISFPIYALIQAELYNHLKPTKTLHKRIQETFPYKNVPVSPFVQ